MKRICNKLIFEPDEEKRFYRAIRLIFSGIGRSHKSESFVEHEKAHVDELKKLGYANEIYAFSIELSDNPRSHDFALGVNYGDVSNIDDARIALAPKHPSLHDCSVAAWALGYIPGSNLAEGLLMWANEHGHPYLEDRLSEVLREELKSRGIN